MTQTRSLKTILIEIGFRNWHICEVPRHCPPWAFSAQKQNAQAPNSLLGR